MSIGQILLILRARWWLVLSILVVVVAATYAISTQLPKKFVAEATLLLDFQSDPLLPTSMAALSNPLYLATQVEIIRSDRVAERVVRMMKLSESAAAVAQWREASEGRVSLDSFYGTLLQKGLVVESVAGSNILSLKFSGADAKFAAAAANSIVRAYIDLTVELRTEPAREFSVFFDERAKALRTEYEAAQSKLSQYQQAKRIIVTDERVDQESARLAAINTQLALAQAELADTSSRSRNAGSETSLDVSSSAAVQAIKVELSRAEARLTEASAVLGVNHPQRQQLETQVRDLKAQLGSEMRRVSGTTATLNRVTGQKLGELRAMAETQKENVLSLRAQRDEMALMQRDVEAAKRSYEAVSQRRSELALESKSDHAGARVLSPAIEPLNHSRPRVFVNVIVAVFLGLMLGAGTAMGLEMLNRRVRSKVDIDGVSGVPVLGVLSSAVGGVWYSRAASGSGGSARSAPPLAGQARPTGLKGVNRLTLENMRS